MSQGELDAAFAHMQARVRASGTNNPMLPKLPKWSQLTSFQKRNLVVRSSIFMAVGWLTMEFFVSRPPKTTPMSENVEKWSEFRKTVREHNKQFTARS